MNFACCQSLVHVYVEKYICTFSWFKQQNVFLFQGPKVRIPELLHVRIQKTNITFFKNLNKHVCGVVPMVCNSIYTKVIGRCREVHCQVP